MEEKSKSNDEQTANELPLNFANIKPDEDEKKLGKDDGRKADGKITVQFDLPQPLLIKEQKEKIKEKIKLSEGISLVALFLSAYAVTLNQCNLKNTNRALAITETTFKENRFKDSIALATANKKNVIDSFQRESGRKKDSVLNDRDSIRMAMSEKSLITQETALKNTEEMNRMTIEVGRQSLNAQINSLRQSHHEFELESRAILQIIDTKVDTVAIKYLLPFSISFKVADMGKFPAIVDYIKVGGFTAKKNMLLHDIKNKVNLFTKSDFHAIVSPSTSFEHTMGMNAFNFIQYEDFMSGNQSIYLIAEIGYKSYGIEKKYQSNLGYEITRVPALNSLNFKNIELADKTVD